MPFQNLYFIALIPPQEISDEITAFKNHIAENYNSKKALKVLPHITLKAPFKLNSDKHSILLEWFRSINITTTSFTIELNGFGAFDNSKNPVIFVKPVVSEELLKLQSDIIRNFENAFPEAGISFIEKNFKPHITIAYRDLEYRQFEKAWPVYRDKRYKAEFKTESFYLMQHDTQQWNIIAEYFIIKT